MITLKKLEWSNCFSYVSNNVLELNDSIVTQLVGTNGTGKSSIPLILEEVLFNKNSKGIKKADIPNREVNNGYDISLTFDVVDDAMPAPPPPLPSAGRGAWHLRQLTRRAQLCFRHAEQCQARDPASDRRPCARAAAS